MFLQGGDQPPDLRVRVSLAGHEDLARAGLLHRRRAGDALRARAEAACGSLVVHRQLLWARDLSFICFL